MIRFLLIPGLFMGCELNRSVPEDTTEDFRSGIPDVNGDIYFNYRKICVQKINQYRTGEGKSPLKHWKVGIDCADGHARFDSKEGRAQAGFQKDPCGALAQNECPNAKSLNQVLNSCLEAMWNEGSGGGQYENMSSIKFTQVVCGFYETPEGRIWAVQNFR